jgi:hypothetical protein
LDENGDDGERMEGSERGWIITRDICGGMRCLSSVGEERRIQEGDRVAVIEMAQERRIEQIGEGHLSEP